MPDWEKVVAVYKGDREMSKVYEGDNLVFDSHVEPTKVTVQLTSNLDQTVDFVQTNPDGVSVDWGDGSDAETSPKIGSWIRFRHTYASAGTYVITIQPDKRTKWSPGGMTMTSLDDLWTTLLGGDAGAEKTDTRPFCTSITFGGNVLFDNAYAFQNFTSLKNVEIPEGTEFLSHSLFRGCTSLSNVVLPKSLKAIGGDAFKDTPWLSSIEKNQGDFVYVNDDILIKYKGSATNVTVPNNVRSIGGAFIDNTDITSVVIPQSVEYIGDESFKGCKGLTSITIPSSIGYIGKLAFYNCTELSSVKFNMAACEFSMSCFGYCIKLTAINVPSLDAWLDYKFKDDYANPVYYSKKLFANNVEVAGEITIPRGRRSIGDFAFQYLINLNKVSVAASVETIGKYAFYESELIEISLPDGLRAIGERAFQKCASLETIVLPDNITSLGEYCFNGCSSIKTITIPLGLNEIPSHCFSSCSSLKSVDIPSNIKVIKLAAFERCTSLTYAFIPNTVELCGSGVFGRCTGLINATISAKNVEGFVLKVCTALKKVWVTSDVETINAKYASNALCASGPDISALTIYVEPTEKPEGWGEYFNYKSTNEQYPVVYGQSTRPF